jgi:hypothetical protein
MSRMLAKLLGRSESQSPSIPPREDGIARQLLLGKIAPPTDFMRNPKLDAAIEAYRDVVGRQQKRIR